MTFKPEHIAPADLNALLTQNEDPFSGLCAVNTNINQQLNNDLAQALIAFDEQFASLLLENRYSDVVQMLGESSKYHPCDDYTKQCSILCELFDNNCPYAPKVVVPEEVKTKSKKSRSRKKKSAAARSSDSKSRTNRKTAN